MRSGLYYGWELTGGGSRAAADLYGEMLGQIEPADHLGFDSALIGESHFADRDLAGSVADLLGALAGSTRFIRLGSAGKTLALQHPARTAEDFAVIDLLSNGRAILGAGAGHAEAAFAAFGVPLKSVAPASRKRWISPRTPGPPTPSPMAGASPASRARRPRTPRAPLPTSPTRSPSSCNGSAPGWSRNISQ